MRRGLMEAMGDSVAKMLVDAAIARNLGRILGGDGNDKLRQRRRRLARKRRKLRARRR